MNKSGKREVKPMAKTSFTALVQEILKERRSIHEHKWDHLVKLHEHKWDEFVETSSTLKISQELSAVEEMLLQLVNTYADMYYLELTEEEELYMNEMKKACENLLKGKELMDSALGRKEEVKDIFQRRHLQLGYTSPPRL